MTENNPKRASERPTREQGIGGFVDTGRRTQGFQNLARAGFRMKTIFTILKKWNVDEETLTSLESETQARPLPTRVGSHAKKRAKREALPWSNSRRLVQKVTRIPNCAAR
jgi:hypothetical protein